jgi:hypothetical protein
MFLLPNVLRRYNKRSRKRFTNLKINSDLIKANLAILYTFFRMKIAKNSCGEF